MSALLSAARDFIENKELSLSVACMLCPHIKHERFNELIHACKSKRAAEKIIRGTNPKKDPEEYIKKQHTAVGPTYSYPGSGLPANSLKLIKDGTPPASQPKKKKENTEIISSTRTCLRLSINSNTEEKLCRVKEIFSSKKD